MITFKQFIEVFDSEHDDPAEKISPINTGKWHAKDMTRYPRRVNPKENPHPYRTNNTSYRTKNTPIGQTYSDNDRIQSMTGDILANYKRDRLLRRKSKRKVA